MPQLPTKDPNSVVQPDGEDPNSAPAEDSNGAPGGDDVIGLIKNIGMGMQMLSEVIQGSGMPGPIMEKAQALLAGFDSLVGDLKGGSQEGGSQSTPQMGSPESSGRTSASPANPGMRG